MIEDITTRDLLQSALKKILFKIPPDAIFTLTGHPGAGKTTLVQEVGALFSVHEKVQSPTFNLMNVYHGQYLDGSPLIIYHLDCYRLNKSDALPDLQFTEFSRHIPFYAFIEWPEKIELNKIISDIAVYALDIDTKWNPEDQKIAQRVLKYDF
ncbi:MAG: tRNA (adenosine(37)-N6)-threonylcarbamoyltransferase complex ATPase subunit type 1 TsaE [Spirochaetia bacterium]|nr:tRNA (adenosine(37)-N6)-threonylcarbamoyltransferase complex ATPase subunit type 1 TsaE [Spirochaetia bacterium]